MSQNISSSYLKGFFENLCRNFNKIESGLPTITIQFKRGSQNGNERRRILQYFQPKTEFNCKMLHNYRKKSNQELKDLEKKNTMPMPMVAQGIQRDSKKQVSLKSQQHKENEDKTIFQNVLKTGF